MTYRVIDFRPYEKGTLRGFFSLVIGDMTFAGFSVHEKNGKRWVGMPAREYQQDGERKFAPQVTFTDDRRKWAFNDWALKELEKIQK
jgi:hypothetical protein